MEEPQEELPEEEPQEEPPKKEVKKKKHRGCGCLGCLPILAGTVILVVFFAALIIGGIIISLGAALNSEFDQTGIVATTQAQSDIPSDQLDMLQHLKSGCGLPWPVVASVAKHESDFGRDPKMRIAHDGGILGYGQFDPATWAKYGNGGDIFSPKDGIVAIDRYLCALGAGKDIRAALIQYTGCVPGVINLVTHIVCVRTDHIVDDYLALANQYAVVAAAGPITANCSFGPAYPSDFGISLNVNFGVSMIGFDATHMQWAWEELCGLSGTKFNTFVKGSRIQVSSLADSRQVGCPGSISVLLGPFSDKATFQVAFSHEEGHVIFNCFVRNTAREAAFRVAHEREGGISYYAQHAESCTGSDGYSEDSADTIAYYLNPGMKRSMVKCETAAGVFTAPDLTKFPLHVAFARDLLGS